MKKILILLLSILLLACVNVEAADYNWAADGDSTKTGGGTGTPTGTPALCFDEDENTLYKHTCNGCCIVTTWTQSEFASSHTITRIKAVFFGLQWATSNYLIEYYDGSWNTADSGVFTGVKQTIDLTELNYTNVTKVKLTTVTDWRGAPYCSVATGVGAYQYELYAYGPPYLDIGVRMRKSGSTFKIGVLPVDATHKLRTRKGATTYGIPLLATNDADASPIRIYDGANVKSLPEVD